VFGELEDADEANDA